MTPMPADQVLNMYFLEMRSKLLDLAASLDRVDRGADRSISDDLRLRAIRSAVRILEDSEPGRAERVQRVFSLEYEPDWSRPGGRP